MAAAVPRLRVNGKRPALRRAGEADADLTCSAGAPYDEDVDALVSLAPVAALLAAFAYWIDRQTGRRIDDLKSENRAAHEQTGKRIDDLKSENRAAHEQLGKRIEDTGKRIEDTGKRIDDLKSENRAAHEQLGRRIEDTGKRIDDTGRRIDALGQRVDKLNDTVNALVPRAAAGRRTEP